MRVFSEIIISVGICVNFAASVIDSVVESPPNKVEWVKSE